MSNSPPKDPLRSPSNTSVIQEDYPSPFFKLEVKTKNKSLHHNPIFANKSDLKKTSQSKHRPISYFNRNTTQFSNSLIKSKVLPTTDLCREPMDLKLSSRTVLNPESQEFMMKSARMTHRPKGLEYSNVSRRQTNRIQINKKPVLDQFKFLIKESQKYLRDPTHRSQKIFTSSKNKIVKTEHNQSNLGDSCSWNKIRKKTNPNVTHKAFFDFGDEAQKKTNATPVVFTFGKYKTIHQRSHSFAKKKLDFSRLWL